MIDNHLVFLSYRIVNDLQLHIGIIAQVFLSKINCAYVSYNCVTFLQVVFAGKV